MLTNRIVREGADPNLSVLHRFGTTEIMRDEAQIGLERAAADLILGPGGIHILGKTAEQVEAVGWSW